MSCLTVEKTQPITCCELSGIPKKHTKRVSEQLGIQIFFLFSSDVREGHRRNAPLSSDCSAREKRRVAVSRASVLDSRKLWAGIFAHPSTDLHKCSSGI